MHNIKDSTSKVGFDHQCAVCINPGCISIKATTLALSS